MPISVRKVEQARIVVVDDQVELSDMIRTALTEVGYAVTVCNNPREALQCIQDVQPHAVIMDVVMPEIDGFQILRQLRKEPSGSRVPVVLMSAAWRQNEKQRQIGTTLDIAPTVVLPKPFELTELENALRGLGVTSTVAV